MSPRRVFLAGLIAASLIAVASPAMALTPKAVIPGWSPFDRPSNPAALAGAVADVTYSASCRNVSATAWSADVADNPGTGLATLLITVYNVAAACVDTPGDLVVRQGTAILGARPWINDPPTGLGSLASAQDRPYIDWDYVPMPRVGQWVGVAARSADGAVLPLLERRITETRTHSFVLDAPVDATYVGAPVVDNTGRALGVVTAAGSVVTGSPQFCGVIFECVDTSRVWWDITAPSEVSNARAVGGKGSVTVTWAPAASDGGDTVVYWYRVGTRAWVQARDFRVTVKARKGSRVTVTLGTVNAAGPGPSVVVSAKAK